MARFFIHVDFFDAERLLDEEGAEFADEAASLIEAHEALKELAIASLQAGDAKVPAGVQVCDASGGEVRAIPVRDVVPEKMRTAR